MEKEALVNIILNDIKEVHNLVNTFKGQDEINAAFINLTRTKIANIHEELSLLEQLNVQKSSDTNSESVLTSQITRTSTEIDNSQIAESSSHFVMEESNIETTPTEEPKKSVRHQTIIESAPIPSDNAPNMSSGQEIISDSQEIKTVGDEIDGNTKEIASDSRENDAVNEVIDTKVDETNSVEKEIISVGQQHTNNSQSNTADSEDIVADTEQKPSASGRQASDQTIIETKIDIKQSTAPNKASVLGEMIKKDSSSVNEILGHKKEQVEDVRQIGKPVHDVKKAFGLNDRFYFQRELFNNNADLFNQTLEQINCMDSYQSAKKFLQANYNWTSDNEACESFYNSIKRRFI